MSNQLIGVDAKLRRADMHFAELGAAIDGFLSEDNYRFAGKQALDPGTG